jgi:hypothetical protein
VAREPSASFVLTNAPCAPSPNSLRKSSKSGEPTPNFRQLSAVSPKKEKQNPLTHKPFVYRPKSNTAFELCATFATDNRHQEPGEAEEAWRHGKGDFCFPLDATQSIPQAPYYY